MQSALRVLVASAAAALFLVACGGEEDERALIPDSELAAVQQELVPPETAPAPSSAGRSLYLRVAWGYLAGNKGAAEVVDWSGQLTVSEGTVQLTHLTYFDRADRPEPQWTDQQISWTSRTRPHFDGLVARVELPSDDATISVDMPLFHHTFRASELTGGDESVFPVDALGHVVSVSSIPASACPGGFALGYVKPSRFGWTAFAGRITDRTGKLVGTLRFKELGDGTLQGRLVDLDGNEVGTVLGTVVRTADGGSFSAELTGVDGRGLGSLTGLFENPSYSARGAFQGSFERACPE